MDIWSRRLGIRTEDRRKLWLMAPVFLICGIAEALTYNGFMTLFNGRFGSAYLPYMYAAEAVIIPLEAWFMSWLTGKLSKPALMRVMYAIMTIIVAANAVVLLIMRAAGDNWLFFYPVLFLTSSFVVRQQTILLWSLAVDVCPTQQAKRLMPLFVAAATLGGVVAGLLTQIVNGLFGPDIVYALGPVMLIAASFNYRKSISRYLVPLALKARAAATGGSERTASRESGREQEAAWGSLDYFRRTVRSPFLLGVLGMMTAMPALYFLMEYVFLNTAHAAYPNEADFGHLFGVVTTVLFALAFLLQLVSGRLMTLLGASGMLAAIAGVYVLSFAGAVVWLGTSAAIALVSGGYMLTYLLLYYTAEPSYQLFYKTLPLAQRDGFRYVAQGIAAFAGILLGAGLQFLHTGFGLGLEALAVVGAVGSVALLALSWYVRQMYMRELVHSLQSAGLGGDGDMAESFRELSRSSRAMGAMLGLLKSPTSSDEEREVALDLIGRTKEVRHLPELLPLLASEGERVRIAALRAMNLAGADLSAMTQVAALLEDPDQTVRTEAVRQLAQMKHLPSQAFFFLRMKLLDPHPAVVAEAVKAMYLLESAQSYEACYEVIGNLLAAGGEPAVHVCRVVGELKLDRFADETAKLLDDTHPSVRVAATACLGELGWVAALPKLLERLPAADQELVRVTEEALVAMGDSAVRPLREALSAAPTNVWKVAACALAKLLPDDEVRGWLAEQAVGKLAENEEALRLPAAFTARGCPDLAELAAMRLRDLRATVHAGVWAVLERLTDERVVLTVRRSVDDADEEVRGGALEVLAEGVGERKLSQRFAAALQAEPATGLAAESATGSMMEAVTKSVTGSARDAATGSTVEAAMRAAPGEASGSAMMAEPGSESDSAHGSASGLAPGSASGAASVSAFVLAGTMSEIEADEALARAAVSSDDWWREMAAEERKRRTEGSGMQEEQGMLGRLNKVVFLKKVPFFADLSLEELGLIAGVATEERFADGDYLLRRGEINSSFYVIVEGNVELTSVSAAGWEGTLGVVGPGDVCGATSALDGSPSAVTAQAFFGDVRLLALRTEEVTRLVRLYPEIGIGLLRASLARIRLLEEMMMRIDS